MLTGQPLVRVLWPLIPFKSPRRHLTPFAEDTASEMLGGSSRAPC